MTFVHLQVSIIGFRGRFEIFYEHVTCRCSYVSCISLVELISLEVVVSYVYTSFLTKHGGFLVACVFVPKTS